MKKLLIITFFLLGMLNCLRPPSVPLIVMDPYTSIWSPSDNLYDAWPQHWAGAIQGFAGMLSIDGKCFRFMGPADMTGSVCPNAMKQTNLKVTATKTVYTFVMNNIQLDLVFTTPAFLDNLDYLSLPITYIDFYVKNLDTVKHSICVYYDNTAEVAVNDANKMVNWDVYNSSTQNILRIYDNDQVFNSDNGDDRISWGYWYIATPLSDTTFVSVNSDTNCRSDFAQGKWMPDTDTRKPRKANDEWPVIAVKFDMLNMGPGETRTQFITVAYDQTISMKYFGSLFVPNWKVTYNTMDDLLAKVTNLNFKNTVSTKATAIDTKISNDLRNSFQGSPEDKQQYDDLGSLVYRQVTGGCVVVWNHIEKDIWVFMKEISSDGDVSTVDVIFPASPLILYMNPEVFYRITLPILQYANNETGKYGQNVPYNLTWAPHHLGQWPVCDLRPDQQEQMPIEETANMLIMMDYIIKNFPHALDLYKRYNNLINVWGQYLTTVLPDPENQLCTDDFEGPSPHNVNLAAKGIVGLGSYSQILLAQGDKAGASKYLDIAQQYVQYWMKNALDVDSKKYKLQYDKPNSWSLKYNIFWQFVLKIELFPKSVTDLELAYYLSQINQYGLPLDNRKDFAKADWEMWAGAMGTDQQFVTIMKSLYKFANETPDRVPFTDWYETKDAKQTGFRARPVMGGIFSKVILSKQQKTQVEQLLEERIMNK